MRILITRPMEAGEHLAQLLQERGHEAVLSPAIDVHFEDGPDILLGSAQAILVTSANGVHALARRTKQRDLPLFAVGPQTAQAARAAGFGMVRDAGGDAEALAQSVCQMASPSGGLLLHVTGDTATDNLVPILSQQGFKVEVLRLYRTSERETLSEAAAGALASGSIDAAMLFSPRSARAFVQQVLRAGLRKNCETIVALCIGAAAADALAPLRFAAIHIAAQPNREAMLALLD